MCLGSGIRDPGYTEKQIPDPETSGQKGTGSRIPNTAKNHDFYCYMTFL
jgi:hypothetical protein